MERELRCISVLAEVALDHAKKLQQALQNLKILRAPCTLYKFAADMVESMEQLPGLLTTSKCRIDVPGLRESLSIVAVDIHHTLLRLNDVSTSKGMLRGLGVKLKAWKSRDELMANIKRIDDELTACFSFITDLTDAEPDFEEATEHGIPATEDQDLSRDQEPLNDRELFLETLRPCLARLKDVFEGHIRDMDADPQQLYTLFEIRGMSLAELSNAIHTVSTIMTKLPKPSFAHKYISRLVEMLETATSHMPPGSSFVQTDRDRLSNAVYLAKILQTLDALGTELDSSTPGGRSPSTMTVETILACIDKLTTDLMHANLISNAHDIISHFIPVLDRMIKNRLHHPAQWPLVGTFLAFLVYLPTCLYRLGYVAEGHTRSLEATSVCIHLAGKYPAAVQLLVVQNLVCTAQDLRTFGFKSSAMLTLEKAMSFMQSVVETPHGLANYSAQILLNASELWLSMKDYKLALKAAKEAVNIRTHLLHAPLDRQETRAHLPCSEFAHEHVFSRATAASTGTHPPLALSPILAIAESWTSVARCCQAMGQPQKALEALNEAVQLQKREEPSLPVAEAQLSGQRSNEGTKHLGEWARLLDEWTGMLSVLGSSTAYDTGQASISIHRRLADENPGTLSTELAHSLVTFWDAYQPPSPASDGAYAHQDNDITGQSTVAIQEAVRIYRAFLHVRPEVHGQQLLAGALTREALSLRQTSPSDSLSIALEAADIWMSINGVDNLGYLDPSFIRTVKLLLVLLAYFRRPEECAALATVAHPLIDTYAAQAEDTPDKYYPELASLLIIVATQLSYLGRYDECAITAQRAATIFTSLHEKGLETKDPALARWQMLLSECLYDRGHLEDSLMWAQKGIRVWRQLAYGQTNAHKHDLAVALSILERTLRALGCTEDALGATEEISSVWHILMLDKPDAYRGDCAWALERVFHLLCELQRLDEASVVMREAAGLLRVYHPDTHASAFGVSHLKLLQSAAAHFLRQGRCMEAYDFAQEAVAVLDSGDIRIVADKDPAAGSVDLAEAYNMLEGVCTATGCHDEAGAARLEAAEKRTISL